MEAEIVNKVASSGLISLDLEDYFHPGERVQYDLKDNLFMELILKEKDFREFLKNHDWSVYKDKNVSVICSADAIIPTWAYMLLAIYLEPFAHMVVFGDYEDLEKKTIRGSFKKLKLRAIQRTKSSSKRMQQCTNTYFGLCRNHTLA
jgi:hypothetical protein